LRAAFVLLVPLAFPLAAQQPLSVFAEAKARSLLHTQLSCLGCHELDGDGGRSAPSLTSVGARRPAAYIRAMVEDPQRALPGAAMPLTPIPAATRELVIRFLSRDARRTGSAPPASTATALAARADGSALYARWCANCHGANGRGDGPNAKYLPVRPAVHASDVQMRDRPDDSLYDAIAGGGAVMGKSARMPSFGATLSREEILSLVAWVRTLCKCEGPTWSRNARKRS
jgi:mono/diheme cytochrome c family protein